MQNRTNDASISRNSGTDQTRDQQQSPSSPPRRLDVAKERSKYGDHRQFGKKELKK